MYEQEVEMGFPLVKTKSYGVWKYHYKKNFEIWLYSVIDNDSLLIYSNDVTPGAGIIFRKYR
jgi:hypothetical protein